MKKFANIFRLVMCVSVLALTSSRALAAPVSVNVVNPTLPVTVGNFPASQAVSGTVSVSNFPAFPATQPVSGTVTVGNATTSPVPTQNVGGGAATEVGQPASNLVNLACFPSGGTIFGNCEQFSSNGAFLPGPYSVPTGKSLVLTDVEWALFNSPVGSTTIWGVQVNGAQAAFATAFGDSGGLATGQLHFATGIVAATGTTITATTGTQMAPGNNSFTYMQGYLVPNP
jgi:hypothetical protein